MSLKLLSSLPRLRFICLFFASVLSLGPSQFALAQGGDATTLLGQVVTAFAGSQTVHQVQLSGNATWYAGDLEDSGTATLTGNADGSYQLQLALSALGQRVESQSGAGTAATCQWSGDDGISHSANSQGCWRPVLWFLPAISLQPSVLTPSTSVADGGTSTVGSNNAYCRVLWSQLTFNNFSSSAAADFAQQNTTQLGLDPTSFMPSILAYSVLPDSGNAVSSALEIHYSDYRSIDGVEVPFLIQRYVNGSLQLSLAITSAQIS